MRTSFRTAASVAALGAAIMSLPAFAQASEADNADEAGGNEIIVTAQKRSESLQKVPIAISAFTSDQLARSGVTNVAQLTKLTPSLLVTEGSGPAQPYIRGIGGRYNTPGNEASTSLYVDGVYLPDKTGMLIQSFPDVQSVQILRGPQGTLFGRNATGGAILVTTKRPASETGAMVEGTYGTDNEGARGFVTSGLSSTLSASASGFYTNDRPYIRNRNPSNGAGKFVGGDKSSGGRVQLRWDPSTAFNATLSAYYTKGQANAGVALQPMPTAPITAGEFASALRGIDIRNPDRSYYGELKPEVRFEGYGSSLTLDADLGAVTVKSISAYNHFTSGVEYDLDGSPVSQFFFDTGVRGRTYQQEVDIASQTQSPFQWIVGGFYLNYRDGFDQLDQFVGLPVPSPLQEHTVPAALYAASAAGRGPTSGLAYIDQHAFVDINSLGLFGEGSFEFSDAAKLTLGLRYTHETHELDANNASTTYVPNGTGGVIPIRSTSVAVCAANPTTCDDLKTPFSKLTYRAVFDYKFSRDFMAYASYNRGFKSGVYNISSIPNVVATTPETLDSFEAGFKSSLLDRRLTFNAAAYHYKYKNLQVTIVNPNTNTQQSINAATATITGLEVETGLRASERLTLNVGMSTFFKADYGSFKNCVIYRPTGRGLAVAANADCSGTRLPSTPDVQFSLQANYNLPLASGGHVDFNGFFSYISKFNHNTHGLYPAGVAGGVAYAAGEGRSPDQAAIKTVNTAVTFHAPNDAFYVSVWGKDLTNQKNVYRNVSQTTFGYYTALSRGISAGVTIGTSFGSQRN